jgi:hypothetical protein
VAVISIFGKIDKRILVFPLIRAYSMTGQTIVITDDGCFKNLYHTSGSTGEIDGVKIMVINDLPPDLSKITQEYQNVIYVLSDMAELPADNTLVCHGEDKTMIRGGTRGTEKNNKDKSITDIYLRMAPIKTKEIQIILKPYYYRYLVETEEKKELLVLKDKKICQLLSKTCSNAVGMKEAQFYMLLLRKRYEISKK